MPKKKIKYRLNSNFGYLANSVDPDQPASADQDQYCFSSIYFMLQNWKLVDVRVTCIHLLKILSDGIWKREGHSGPEWLTCTYICAPVLFSGR